MFSIFRDLDNKSISAFPLLIPTKLINNFFRLLHFPATVIVSLWQMIKASEWSRRREELEIKVDPWSTQTLLGRLKVSADVALLLGTGAEKAERRRRRKGQLRLLIECYCGILKCTGRERFFGFVDHLVHQSP